MKLAALLAVLALGAACSSGEPVVGPHAAAPSPWPVQAHRPVPSLAEAIRSAAHLGPAGPETTVSLNSGFYHGEYGAGIAIAHRLDTALPMIVHGSYANGGGNQHVGRAGVAVEF